MPSRVVFFIFEFSFLVRLGCYTKDFDLIGWLYIYVLFLGMSDLFERSVGMYVWRLMVCGRGWLVAV